jgi:tetratricopeptide (TPR) repeat protein
MMRKYLFVIIMSFIAVSSMAQNDRKYIRSGNKLYRQQNFVKAEAEYRKALSVNGENPQALYNLGCALMMQQKDSAAIEQYQKAGKVEKTARRKSQIFHNIGVICQNHKMYGDAIEAYKESLRNNPNDDETRYNLALCKRLNKKQQQQQNKNDKNKQNKQNDKNKDKDKKEEQNKKDNQKKDKQEQQKQMSKDNAEQLLNAAMQNEKATQQRVKDAMRQNRSRKLQKNW